MKLTTFILLTACITASAKTGAQTITLSEKNAPLSRVFEQIKKQTGYTFAYTESLLSKGKTVSISVKNATLEQALELCFKDQPFTYDIIEKTIVVKPKLQSPSGEGGNEQRMANSEPPPIDITGKVTDADGNPLAGATVKVKGSTKATVTNNDGVFVLKGVDENATLEISYVGYEKLNVSVNNRTSIVTSLKVSPSPLDQVQIIAYGTRRVREQTGNVSTVKGEDIAKQPINNPLLALEGRVPGLFITQNNGLPGGGITVRIQGQNSIRNGNDPLYVVDGVPYIQELLSTGVSADALGNSGGKLASAAVGVGNPLSYINPSDIESIEVLKDADATAIYGSRAANGAILITTKKGKQGERKIDVNMQTGWGKVARRMDMMNTRQYLDMRYQALQNDGINWQAPSFSANDLKVYDTTRYTDWQKELIGGTARYTNINTSISGGAESFQYFVGGTFHKETTVFPGNFDDQKGGINFNLNSGSAKQRFHFQLSGNYLFDDNQLPISDVTQNAVLLEPDAPPLYNADGSLNWQPNSSGTSTFTNPIGDKLTNTYRNKTNNLVSNAVISYRILPGFDFRSSIGYTHMQTTEFAATYLESTKPENRPNASRIAQYGHRNITSWIAEPQLNFDKNIWQGKIQVLVGTTINQIRQDGYSVYGFGYRTDAAMKDILSATTIYPGISFNSVYKYNAGFARLNYNFREKYIINVNARRDGSSRFGPKSRFHNFGSIGGAWIFTKEHFIGQNLKFLSFGKIRGSYGTTGNDQIGEYTYMNLFNSTTWSVPYQGTTGSAPLAHNNPYLQWEETKKLSVGLDLGFLFDKIIFSANYQKNKSSNQLLPYSLPISSGFPVVTLNFPATIENTSWEFSLNSSNVKTKNFTWSSNFNLTIPKNKLVEFPNISSTSYASSLVIGEPISIIKVYRFIGVDPATGKYIVADSAGNATNTPNSSKDRIGIINSGPKFYGGFQNSIIYKGFQLDFLFQFVKQLGFNYAFNANKSPGQFFSGLSNQPVTVLNSWKKPGDIANIQRYSTSLFTSNATSSDAAYSDASYIRLKNVSFSYNIPENLIRKLRLSNCRIYAQGQNLLTITNYKGLDPETQSISSLPPLRVITIGLQIGL